MEASSLKLIFNNINLLYESGDYGTDVSWVVELSGVARAHKNKVLRTVSGMTSSKN